MDRFEGRVLVAYWLIGTCSLAAVRLAVSVPTLLENVAGWRAAAGPAVMCMLGIGAAIQLLRSWRGFGLAGAVLASQILAISVGPVAYRLDVGPFFRIAASAAGFGAHFGNGARLLLVVGWNNHVPEGVAINILALGVLLLLLASRHASSDAAAG